MADAPLIITSTVIAGLYRLRQFAAKHPIDMTVLMHAIKTPEGERLHRKQMNAQSIRIPGPWPFFVTFSIETNQPVGTCRHMSMSILREGRAPGLVGVWMVAEHLGFAGGLEACRVWPEELSDRHGGTAINVVQPLSVGARGNG